MSDKSSLLSTLYDIQDYVYLEPPDPSVESYYIGRILEINRETLMAQAFHLICAGITKALPKGFAWECATCQKTQLEKSKKLDAVKDLLEEDPDSDEDPSSATTELEDIQDIVKKQNEQYLLSESQVLVLNELSFTPRFPFRYFGVFSKAIDLIEDLEGRPKAHSRVGKSYQVQHLPEVGHLPTELSESNGPSEITMSETPKKPGRKRKGSAYPENQLIIHERSDESIFVPEEVDLSELENYLDRVHTAFCYEKRDAQVTYAALESLGRNNYDTEKAFEDVSIRDVKGIISTWEPEHIKRFEELVLKHGLILPLIHHDLPEKSMRELVLFYYHWKKSDRYIPIYSEYCKEHRPHKDFKKSKASRIKEDTLNSPMEEDAKSEAGSETIRAHECALCLTVSTKQWHLRLIDGHKIPICSQCASHFLKYAQPRLNLEGLKKENIEKRKIEATAPVVEERKKRKAALQKSALDPMKSEMIPKSESLPITSQRLGVKKESKRVIERARYLPKPKETKETNEQFAARPCAVCFNIYEDNDCIISHCRKCKLRVHIECYGLEKGQDNLSFICDRCRNMEDPEISQYYDCVLCVNPFSNRMSALKKTIGNNWAHVCCAVWIPQVQFGDVDKLNSIECIGLIDEADWNQNCSLCGLNHGVTIKCDERNCQARFHVTCAHLTNECLLSMERMRGLDSPVKPVAYCSLHSKKRKQRKETVSIGLDSNRLPLLLKEYVVSHKRAPVDLVTVGSKKFYSLDLLDTCNCHDENVETDPVAARRLNVEAILKKEQAKSCVKCQSSFSPFWWDSSGIFLVPNAETLSFLCQSCMWATKED